MGAGTVGAGTVGAKGRRDFLRIAGAGVAGAMVLPSASAARAGTTSQAQAAGQARSHAGVFAVRDYGAAGDGKTLDTAAVNGAIEAAAAAGGGTVMFAAGEYLCYSIHLKSNVALSLGAGATVIAADPLPVGQAGGYDDPEVEVAGEPEPAWKAYQDYGHNHWHNSLLWGEGLTDVAITGPGRIWGRGLARDWARDRQSGIGNKAIALKNCHNVLLKDFQILQGGWFGILATGVDNLTIDGLTIDTNRDGMDIDCCRNVRVSNCTVNSPWDDAIVPKSSYALGYLRATENVAIANCYVTGAYQIGSVLDGTWKRFEQQGLAWHTGRIKLGTESNGGFRNIAIANCVFEGCQGLALETVDGAVIEDVTITNITMRGIVSAPIFMRLGSRLRGPAGTKTGALRRVLISNVVCSGAAAKYGCIVSGVPGFAIEDVRLENIFIEHEGGGGAEAEASAKIAPPENENKYPEPNMFGAMPSQGFFLRHAKNVELGGIEIRSAGEDARPAFVLRDVQGARFFDVKTPEGAPVFDVEGSAGVEALWVRGVRAGGGG
jgi:polygalacturonase